MYCMHGTSAHVSFHPMWHVICCAPPCTTRDLRYFSPATPLVSPHDSHHTQCHPVPGPPPLQTPLSRLCESADLIFVRYVRHSFSASVSHVTCYAPTPVLSLGCPTSCESRDKNACAVPFHEGRRGKLSLASIHRKHSIIFQVIHRLTQCLIRVQSAPTPQPTPSKA